MDKLYMKRIEALEDRNQGGSWYFIEISDGRHVKVFMADRNNMEEVMHQFILMFNEFAPGYKIDQGRLCYE